jgi:hypothetical protein
MLAKYGYRNLRGAFRRFSPATIGRLRAGTPWGKTSQTRDAPSPSALAAVVGCRANAAVVEERYARPFELALGRGEVGLC